MPVMTFEEAKRAYVHRFTLEHVPAWARLPFKDGRFPAPQYASDWEWFTNTQFPPNNPFARSKRDTFCYSNNQTWPLGQTLSTPYHPVNVYA